MRVLIVLGVLLVVLGAYVLVRGVSYPSQKSVLKVGEFEATYEEQRAVPTWVGAVVAVAGLALIGFGARKRGGGRDPA
jgi:hypothetical protein